MAATKQKQRVGTSGTSVLSSPSLQELHGERQKKVGTVGETREGTTRKHYIHADTGTQVSCRVTQNVDRLQLTNAIKQQLLSFFSLVPLALFRALIKACPLSETVFFR